MIKANQDLSEEFSVSKILPFFVDFGVFCMPQRVLLIDLPSPLLVHQLVVVGQLSPLKCRRKVELKNYAKPELKTSLIHKRMQNNNDGYCNETKNLPLLTQETSDAWLALAVTDKANDSL